MPVAVQMHCQWRFNKFIHVSLLQFTPGYCCTPRVTAYFYIIRMADSPSRSDLFLKNSLRARNDGNVSLSSGDVQSAVSAYKQSVACVTVALQSGADKFSPAIIAAGVLANANLSLALLRVGDAVGALDAANEALLFDATHEKALWRRVAALRDIFQKTDNGRDGSNALASTTSTTTSMSDILAAVNSLLSIHPGNVEGIALLAIIETGGEELLSGISISTLPKQNVKGNSDGGGILRGLSSAKTKAALSGLYADAPGYDEPMRDIRPLPSLGSSEWWSDICCCRRKRKVT